MDFDKYKNDVPLKKYPRKPRPPSPATAAQARAFADELDVYTKLKEEWDAQREVYNQRQAEIEEEFYNDLCEDLGITGHPKAGKLFSIAWEKGHSSGYQEVYVVACDLVDLIK